MLSFTLYLLLASVFPTVFAHYKIHTLIVNGTRSEPYYYIRKNTNGFNFLDDVTSLDMRCNQGTLASGPRTEIATIIAGSEVGMAADQPMFHPGPVSIYMSRSEGNIRTYDGSGPWFKIAENGLDRNESDIWSYYLWYNLNQREFNFTIPASTPPGDYLLRFEHLGVHDAMYYRGSQFYISCAHVRIVGEGRGSPAPLVNIPGAYLQNDSGLYMPDSERFPYALPNYTDNMPIPVIKPPTPQEYDIPGPPVWLG